ncbi:MAG: DUF4838 domain-containing protein [Kiritimatiellae bacterium]|nr:DUF4838 domain-containing protein [Kiritimatiellia bacterium]
MTRRAGKILSPVCLAVFAAACTASGVRYDGKRNIAEGPAFRGGPDFEIREVYSRSALKWPRSFGTTQSGDIPEDPVLGRCHTFDRIVPPGEFFDAHPEYFSERGGKRIGENTQLCLSNPEVVAIAKERVLKRISESRGAVFFGISQNDNMNFCQCDKCAAIDAEEGSHAGSIVRFVNAIAEEVGKVRPDATVTTLAYMYSRKPPVTPLAPNAAVWLCTTGIDYSRPLDDASSRDNAAFLDDLRGWRSKAPRGVYIWDYAVNFRNVQMPFPDIDAVSRNFRVYRAHGVKGVFFQMMGGAAQAPFEELKGFLASRLMWNADLDGDVLVDEFVDAYYGRAAVKVVKIIHLLEAREKRICSFDESVYSRWLDDGFIEKLDSLWLEALALASGDGEREFNVRLGRLSAVYPRFARAVCRMSKTQWLCASPAAYCARERAAADLAYINEMRRAAAERGLELAFTSTESFSRLSARWGRALLKKIPELPSDAAVYRKSEFVRYRGGWRRSLDDTAFDAGSSFSLSVKGLAPGSFACILDETSGETITRQAGDGENIILELAKPVPVLDASLWTVPPEGVVWSDGADVEVRVIPSSPRSAERHKETEACRHD